MSKVNGIVTFNTLMAEKDIHLLIIGNAIRQHFGVYKAPKHVWAEDALNRVFKDVTYEFDTPFNPLVRSVLKQAIDGWAIFDLVIKDLTMVKNHLFLTIEVSMFRLDPVETTPKVDFPMFIVRDFGLTFSIKIKAFHDKATRELITGYEVDIEAMQAKCLENDALLNLGQVLDRFSPELEEDLLEEEEEEEDSEDEEVETANLLH